jgi:hypothetical protein
MVLKEDPATKALRGLCVAPFYDVKKFGNDTGCKSPATDITGGGGGGGGLRSFR